MTLLATHAIWLLAVAFAGSLLYELYRASARAGTSRHDSRAALARQIPLYMGAAIVIGLLFAVRVRLLDRPELHGRGHRDLDLLLQPDDHG
jgi:UDP-N-acetylmuramyl pentapeptide phosphotransferase/UDP-N-acetylglucosamine-1-phosphate transferase